MNLDSCFHRKPWIPAEVYPRESGGGNDENGAKRTFYEAIKIDDLVKSLKKLFLVIPVKTGIQYYQVVKSSLDSRFRGSDDFLRSHQNWQFKFCIEV